jgi:ribosomal protein S18 acetylase RimI-like enzyme
LTRIDVVAAGDVEAIERATVEAVVPEALEEVDGWLLAFDSGVVARAKSAAPLNHERCEPVVVEYVEQRYAAHGKRPMFRVADVPGLAALQAALRARGYRPDRPTLVQIAGTSDVLRAAAPDGVRIDSSPDQAWVAAFLGEGFDPVDGASRAETLARGKDTVFASIREGDVAIGAGAASFSHGWASIHGMRTALHRRGERIGARVMAALAQVAHERSLPRIFLQVDGHNEPAVALYRRAGFVTAWQYAYWSRAD